MRERLSVRGLDRTVVNKFKEYVKAKYGKLHTVYGIEVEKALREYLDKYAHSDEFAYTRTHETTTPKPKEGNNKIENTKSNSMYASNGNNGGSEVEKLFDPDELSIPPSEKTKRKIILHLKRLGMLDVERINENAVKRVIGMEAGYDPRTINKYFHLLENEYILPYIQYTDKGDSRKLR